MKKPKTVSDLAARWLRRKPDSLTEAENRVLQSAIERLVISENDLERMSTQASVADRIADAIARIGGSWTFILSFIAFLLVWTLANAWFLGRDSFDPYPFIFLNLVLSMLAALQAPIIMMSQNRSAEHDRRAAQHDYEVNLKAEIEIMALHEKLDSLRDQEIAALREQVTTMSRAIENLSDRSAS